MPKLKYTNDKDPWMLAEHFPDIDFFFSQIFLSSFVNDLKNSCGRNYKKVLAVFKPKYYIHFYYGKRDSLNFEQHLIKLMKRNTEFGFLINKNIIKWSNKLREFSAELGNLNLKKLTNKELKDLLERQDNIHTHLYEWGWLSNATDMFHASFTNELKDYLDKRLVKHKKGMKLNKIFNILTSPHKRSVVAEEDENLLKIAGLIKNNKKGKLVEKLISEHYVKYFFLKHLWLGKSGVYTKSRYIKLAQSLARDKISPEKKIIKINKELAKIKKQKQKYFQELKISKRYKDLFSIYSDFMLTKIFRRYAQIFWAYQASKLLKEISKRLKLTLDEIRYMLPDEIKRGLIGDRINRKEIRRRINFCFYYVEEGVDLISSDSKHKILKQLKFSSEKNLKELKGQIGCLGKVKGIVKIVNTQKEINKMEQGNILVSIATNPDLVPAMKKAAAIVTEQGGVTSHAAIVARELKIPCVIGTKIATKVLKDGNLVEVDADKGIVKILK